MPEISQYNYTFKEAATLLVKDSGIHEGKWQLVFNLNVLVGIFGSDQTNSLPGSMTQIQGIAIQRVAPNSPPSDLTVVDAAEVNPRPKASKSKNS